MYENNRDKIIANSRAWYARNRERVAERHRFRHKEIRQQLAEWNKKNPEKRRVIARKAAKKQRERADVRIRQGLRHRIYMALRGNAKSARTMELIGMDLKEFKIYIQGQFRPGMAWENYGPVWHIDHVRPCASFDLTDPVQQRECFHWENLQPLFAEENLRKGAKYAGA